MIWLTHGHRGAAARLTREPIWRISTVTYIELAQGCRDRTELARFKKGLTARNTQIMPLSEAISERAMRLIDQHALGDGLQLGDALIAATALEAGAWLAAINRKRQTLQTHRSVLWWQL